MLERFTDEELENVIKNLNETLGSVFSETELAYEYREYATLFGFRKEEDLKGMSPAELLKDLKEEYVPYLMERIGDDRLDYSFTKLNYIIVDYIKSKELFEKNPRLIMAFIENDDMKMVKVDGVELNIENIKNGKYSITTPVYAITYKDNDKLNVQLLIEWILSEEGQEIVEKAGYVGVK